MEKQTKQYRDKRNISSKTEASVKVSDFSNPLLQSTTGLRSYFLIKSYCCAIYVCSLRRSASQLLTCCCSTSLLLLKFKFSIILCSNFFVNFERLPFFAELMLVDIVPTFYLQWMLFSFPQIELKTAVWISWMMAGILLQMILLCRF